MMSEFSRRTLLSTFAAASTGALLPQTLLAQNPAAPPAPRFGYEDVVRRAREFAAAPYDTTPPRLPEELEKLEEEIFGGNYRRETTENIYDLKRDLLGLKRAYRRVFEGIAWSTEEVAQQTLARAAEIGLPVHTLPIWYDVDDITSLQRLFAEFTDGMDLMDGLQRYAAEHSRARIRALLNDRKLAVVFSAAPAREGPCIRQRQVLG